METLVGSRLLLRTTRSVALTDEGRRLYEQIWPIQSAIEAAAAASSSEIPSGRLRINVDPYFGDYFAAHHLALFLNSYPSLDLDLIARPAVGDLLTDGFDLAVRFGGASAPHRGSSKVGQTRILTVAAPSYLERVGTPRAPADLVYHDCIQLGDPATGRTFDWRYRRGRKTIFVRTAGRLLVTDFRELQGACLAGAGIARIVALGAANLLKEGRLIELFSEWPDASLDLCAIHATGRTPETKAMAFIDFCRREIQ